MSGGKRRGVTVGGACILTVFTVLCLTTFSALSLASARADYKLAQKAHHAATQYYAAEEQAETVLSEWITALRAGQDITGPLQAAGGSAEQTEEGLLLTYSTQSGSTRLMAEVLLQTDASGQPTGRVLYQHLQPVTGEGTAAGGEKG